MNKILAKSPEIWDEKRLQKETAFNRFEWRKINGLWINVVREFELKNGIYILKDSNDKNKN